MQHDLILIVKVGFVASVFFSGETGSKVSWVEGVANRCARAKNIFNTELADACENLMSNSDTSRDGLQHRKEWTQMGRNLGEKKTRGKGTCAQVSGSYVTPSLCAGPLTSCWSLYCHWLTLWAQAK